MASLTRRAASKDAAGRKNPGTFALQFIDADGRRVTIGLGQSDKRTAEEFRRRFELLESAARMGVAPDGATAEWVATLAPRLRRRLVKLDLIEPDTETAPVGEPAAPRTLERLVADFMEARTNAKDRTRTNWRHAAGDLLSFFEAAATIDGVTEADAETFHRRLLSRYAESTANKRHKNCRQFFAWAVKRRWIDRDPLAGIKIGAAVDASKRVFIDAALSARVFEALPSAEWRMLFALARYGGLRIPSEAQRLRWADVAWAENRFVVHSPKTEHHRGKASRVVPLFTELEPHVAEAFEAADDGAEFSIPTHRSEDVRTTFGKLRTRAGIQPWPKLWTNCRLTRATELRERCPSHVVAGWLGHSVEVENAHYVQTTEDHFAAASARADDPAAAPRGLQYVCNPERNGDEPGGSVCTSSALGHEKPLFPGGNRGFRYSLRDSNP